MNKRRRYKAKSRRRWRQIVTWQMQPIQRGTATGLAIAQMINAACARAMGIPKHIMNAEMQRRARDRQDYL